MFFTSCENAFLTWHECYGVPTVQSIEAKISHNDADMIHVCWVAIRSKQLFLREG